MQDKSKILKDCLNNLKCKVYSRTIDTYDILSIRDQILQSLQQFKDTTIALNLTGGTKIMALGAFQAMISTSEHNQVLYLDSANQQLLQLFPYFAKQSLPDVLDVATALKAYGFAIRSYSRRAENTKYYKLTEYLVRHVSWYARSLAQLNYYASQAGLRHDLTVNIHSHDRSNKHLIELIELFKDYGLLTYDGHKVLSFVNEPNRFFVNGGWLEAYVVNQIRGLKKTGHIFDWCFNLHVLSLNKAENEIDIAFTVKNRLHLIECKTVNYSSQRNLAKGDQAAYKLDSLRDMMAGTFGKAIIVSYQKMTKHDRQRCRDLGIFLIESEELIDISSRFIQWINT
jgi:hypothetical protein